VKNIKDHFRAFEVSPPLHIPTPPPPKKTTKPKIKLQSRGLLCCHPKLRLIACDYSS
jgi:hypothetical protein